jgi:hypothetical protein
MQIREVSLHNRLRFPKISRLLHGVCDVSLSTLTFSIPQTLNRNVGNRMEPLFSLQSTLNSVSEVQFSFENCVFACTVPTSQRFLGPINSKKTMMSFKASAQHWSRLEKPDR